MQLVAHAHKGVLNTRLRELRESGIVEEPGEDGYALTRRGRQLVKALTPLDAWSKSWEAGS